MSSQNFPHLFSPITIRNVEIRNRVVMLPHETVYGGEDHLPTRKQLFYYRERAMGGVGLVVVPSMGVHPSGSYAHQVHAYNRDAIPGLKAITDAVHAFGAKIFGQLTHYGNQSRSIESHRPLWAPSAQPDMTVGEVPWPMTVDQIHEVVAGFGVSAANLIEAGFDGVEIKVAHDGVLRQFLSPHSNHRTDEYGGSAENRARIVMEVLREVRRAIGDHPLGVRFNINEYIPDGYGVDEAIGFAKQWATIADYITSDSGTWETIPMMIPPAPTEHGFLLPDVARVKAAISIPVIGTGRIVRPQEAEKALSDGACDMVGMARQMIADPFWAAKAQRGDVDDIVQCIGCNERCIARLLADKPITCVVNPAAGFEEFYGHEKQEQQAQHPEKVVVIGGGPAGERAAELAARKGNRVVLFEKENQLGGRVNWESRLPGKAEYAGLTDYEKQSLQSLKVDVRLGTEADAGKVLAEKPDRVILAAGSTIVAGGIAGEGAQSRTFSTLDALDGRVSGQRVLVLDYEASPEGASVVDLLSSQGKQVTWVTPAFGVAMNVDPTISLPLFQRLGKMQVHAEAMQVPIRFENGTVTLLNPYLGTTSNVEGIDAIVVTGAKQARQELFGQLQGRVPRIDVIGDAASPRTTGAALLDATDLILS
jgi:2,4-dienoyl-CoA reductase-like NADH-dependent reductase (Old Yellow Enzyme family)